MADNLITCPKCNASIRLSDVLSQPILEQAKRDAEKESAKALAEIAEKQKALEADRERIEKEAARKADEKNSVEKRDLQLRIQEQNKKIEEAQAAELALRGEKRKIEEQQKELNLQLQRKLDEERKKIEEQTRARVVQENHQKDLEAKKREADLTKTVDDLKRQMAQGSQQMQGEVVELEMESQLREQFPNDIVEPVAKGVRGADVVQKVFRGGKPCGTIIWELKQTKAWSDGWIDKLKVDRDAAKADVAVVVTAALPRGVETFAQVNGVWVTSQACMPGLAAALRWAMAETAAARNLSQLGDPKMKALHQYLSGNEFKQRAEAILDGTMALMEQLESERRLYEKNWSARQKMILRAQNGLLNMRGDLEGLGTSLEHIAAIDVPLEELAPPPAKPALSQAAKTTRQSVPDKVSEEDETLF